MYKVGDIVRVLIPRNNGPYWDLDCPVGSLATIKRVLKKDEQYAGFKYQVHVGTYCQDVPEHAIAPLTPLNREDFL